MRFFEQQALARRNTALLVVLFVIMANLISALNAVAVTAILEIRELWVPVHLGSLIFFLVLYLQYRRRWADGATVAASLEGRPLTSARSEGEVRLRNVVEEMSLASGVPVPALYIIEDKDSINAFAAGTDMRFAVIGVTRGAVEKLTREEIQAVVAHEFSHILNEDMVLNMRLASVVSVFTVFSTMGRMLTRQLDGRAVRARGSGPVVMTAFAIWVFGSLGLLVSRLLQAMIARQREYLADASSAQFTRYPQALASALAKIAYRTGGRLLSPEVDRFGHFFFVEATALEKFLASHPPTEDRIRRLVPDISLEDLAARVYQEMKATADEQDLATLTRRLARSQVRQAAKKGGALLLPALEDGATGTGLLDRIGGVREGDLLTARSRLTRMGHLLGTELRTAEDGTNALRALVASLQDAPAREAVFESLEKRRHGWGREVAALVRAIPSDPADRMTVLRMALGLAQVRPLAERAALVAELRVAASADRRWTWFEMLLILTAERQLAGEPARGALVRGLWAIPDRVFRLLFWAVSDGRGSETLSESERAAVFETVRGAFPGGGPPDRLEGIRIPPVSDTLAFDDFATADRLARQEKARLLRAFMTVLKIDGRIGEREAESLRLAAWMFGVPVPPLD